MGAAPRANDLWEARFDTQLKEDGCAERIFDCLLDKGIPKRRLVLLLGAVADPEIDSRIRRFVEDAETPIRGRNAYGSFFPSQRKARQLAENLRDTAAQIRQFWLHTFLAALPNSKTADITADLLDEQAKALDEARWNVITNRLGYKGFWKQFPLALLCSELNVPDEITYVDLSQLLGPALRAHSFRDDDPRFSPDALRKQFERFCKRLTARGGDLTFLHSFLKLVLPSD